MKRLTSVLLTLILILTVSAAAAEKPKTQDEFFEEMFIPFVEQVGTLKLDDFMEFLDASGYEYTTSFKTVIEVEYGDVSISYWFANGADRNGVFQYLNILDYLKENNRIDVQVYEYKGEVEYTAEDEKSVHHPFGLDGIVRLYNGWYGSKIELKDE